MNWSIALREADASADAHGGCVCFAQRYRLVHGDMM